MTILIISLKNISNYRQIALKAGALKEQWKGEEKSKTLKTKKGKYLNPFMKNLFLNNISIYIFSVNLHRNFGKAGIITILQ